MRTCCRPQKRESLAGRCFQLRTRFVGDKTFHIGVTRKSGQRTNPWLREGIISTRASRCPRQDCQRQRLNILLRSSDSKPNGLDPYIYQILERHCCRFAGVLSQRLEAGGISTVDILWLGGSLHSPLFPLLERLNSPERIFFGPIMVGKSQSFLKLRLFMQTFILSLTLSMGHNPKRTTF